MKKIIICLIITMTITSTVNAAEVPRESAPCNATNEAILVVECFIGNVLIEVQNGLGYADARAKSNRIFFNAYFPEKNVRFIAVNDCVDSADGDNELAPFRNVMNEMYARDISRKVRSSHRIRGNAGEPLSQPPYGYMKSPDNPKFWIIDEEAAQVVRSVFKMCIEGKGNETIARILQESKVLVPMAYWQSKGLDRGGKKTQSNPYKWCKTTISKMLAQQEYCGDVINFKTYSKNFKNKARIPNPKESWSIFKDVHEPIIEREMFEHVQELVKKQTKRRPPKAGNGEKNMFTGLLYCADCGSKMWYHVRHNKETTYFFSCSNYKGDRNE